MPRIETESLQRHLKTHSERSDDDRAAVAVLQTFLRSGGKINTKFESNDKWPNTDGTFEFVSEPAVSKQPEQNFFVQIKGTRDYSEKDGSVKYLLQNFAFPAYIFSEVTADPGILFVVLNPGTRGEERVFWKYMSAEFIHDIDYRRNSCTLTFTPDEEIKNTDESIDAFCKCLTEIGRRHSFVKKLENRSYGRQDILKIIARCDEEITESIARIDLYNDTRDNVSRRILSKLEDLCGAALLLNALRDGENSACLQQAWEHALLDRKTKYLSDFLRKLKYIARRIPDDGQSARLMNQYYDFLWQIRRDLKKDGIEILANLEQFPREFDATEKSYYELIAHTIESHIAVRQQKNRVFSKARYYVEKQTPFYVDGKRYYEITLQLAGIYATKFNRLTVYSEEYFSTSYSVQIAYETAELSLWNVKTDIKLITDWKVSIDPFCLNKLAEMIRLKMAINSGYNEYDSLMKYLTKTGMNLTDFIDCGESNFNRGIEEIYAAANTDYFRQVLLRLRKYFGADAQTDGKNTIRYLLIRMREESITAAMPDPFHPPIDCDEVYLSSKCIPFERNPFLSNFAGRKNNRYTVDKDAVRAAGYDKIDVVRPYLAIKKAIGETGEIYFDESIAGTGHPEEKIEKFNAALDGWERKNGFILKTENGKVYIDSFERDTLFILQRLLELSRAGNKGQEIINKNYVRSREAQFSDPLKRQALEKIFVSSRVFMIYGAAGTGKTTLINYIAALTGNRKKLFLTKTHTALQNLRRVLDNPGANSDFVSIDSFTKKVKLRDYNVIFVDECSTIDNRTMAKFFGKIGEDALVVLAGDVGQLEAIDFGNWFVYAKEMIPDCAKTELLNTWRTNCPELLSLWNEIRENGILVREKLSPDGAFSEEIGENVLTKLSEGEEDEAVLCLNYDGKFGLNNMNALFQAKNTNPPYTWQEWTYKVGDPVLFTDSKRFSAVFYNNLKGRIVNIEKKNEHLTFTVDIDRLLSESDCTDDAEYIETFENATRVRFTVYDTDGRRKFPVGGDAGNAPGI
mgnify:CR=1 FL=1